MFCCGDVNLQITFPSSEESHVVIPCANGSREWFNHLATIPLTFESGRNHVARNTNCDFSRFAIAYRKIAIMWQLGPLVNQ